MRYVEERTAGSGATVYLFAFGKEELKVLYGALHYVHRLLPKMLETQNTRYRLGNMTGRINKFWMDKFGKQITSKK